MSSSLARSPFYAVAHELLNPLASIRGCVESLSDPRIGPAIREELFDVIRRQSENLDWLIRAAVADPKTGDVHMETFDAAPILHDVARLPDVTLSESAISVAITADEKRFRSGVEALLIAMTHGGSAAHIDAGNGRIRVSSAFSDVGDVSFAWKVRLARAWLRRSGIRMRMHTRSGTTVATLRYEAHERRFA